MSPVSTDTKSGRQNTASHADMQKRQVLDIEEIYEVRDVPENTAESRLWNRMNELSGGTKSGTGRRHHHYSMFNDYRELLQGEHFFISFPLCV